MLLGVKRRASPAAGFCPLHEDHRIEASHVRDELANARAIRMPSRTRQAWSVGRSEGRISVRQRAARIQSLIQVRESMP